MRRRPDFDEFVLGALFVACIAAVIIGIGGEIVSAGVDWSDRRSCRNGGGQVLPVEADHGREWRCYRPAEMPPSPLPAGTMLQGTGSSGSPLTVVHLDGILSGSGAP